ATPGVLVKPTRALSFGLSARTPINLSANDGVVTVLSAPLGQPIPDPGHATLKTQLPWYWRFGARYAFVGDDGFENGDLELDGTYETWGQSQGTGPQIHIDHLGPAGAAFDDINITVAHAYNDTYSVRAGGAINTHLPVGVLSVRLGAYYDRSATASNPGYTRLDFDTLDKIAGTVGTGFTWNGLTFNLAYAEVFEPGRTVAPGEGQIRPIDGAQHGAPVDSQGNLLPAVNEGKYSGHTEIFSFGVVAVFDEILGWPRAKTWAHERAAPKADEPKDEPKREEPSTKEPPAKDDDAEATDASNDAPPAPSAHRAPAKKSAAPVKKSDWND
ncbi:MAG TPA: hypothetical protein VIY73_26480, partial [Polyangiaceae bacterium]